MISTILLEVHRTLDYVEFPIFPRDDDYSSTSIDGIMVLLYQMIAIIIWILSEIKFTPKYVFTLLFTQDLALQLLLRALVTRAYK